MQKPQEFDLVVIGGGPGGYVAAIRASQLGLKVALVEKDHLGGICLNWGCIPTKTLLRTSELHHMLHRLDEFGLSASNISIDLQKIIDRSRQVAKQLSTGIQHLLKKNKVSVFEAHGELLNPNLVDLKGPDHVSKGQLKAKNIILATGARARTLPGIEADGDKIWTYKEAMTPTKLPKSIIVIGSGAIGIEFASFYSDLGVKVEIVEALDRIVPGEDAEISDIASKLFQKQGIKLHTSSKVLKVEKSSDGVSVFLRNIGKDTCDPSGCRYFSHRYCCE
jgi:dihydrolipoamide dehydrogenase